MRKKHWLKITLITLAACGLAGVILAVILFNANPGRTGVSSSIEFSFEGAAEGLAPNGYRYDVNGLQSDDVLNASLEETGLANQYTPDQLRANLIISGVYPEDIVEQMTNYESLLSGDAGRITVGDYHATLYNTTLYNDFDKTISREKLESLLSAIMKEYQTTFMKTYAVFLAKDSMLDNLEEYDYPQQLEILSGTISRDISYAQKMADEHSDFLMNGIGFADFTARFEVLRDSDLERISGQVAMNALSQNLDRIVVQYENQIKVLQIQLKELQTESEDVEVLIAQYDKDDIIYVSTSETLQQVGGSAADTYDKLVTRRQEIAESIADLNKELAQVQLKLSDIRGEKKMEKTEAEAVAEGTEETAEEANTITEEEREALNAEIEKGISTVVVKLNKTTEDFTDFLKAYSEREMNERTVAITPVKYSAPKLLSGTFAKQAIKTAGPICVLGLLACIAIMIINQRKAAKREK